MEKFAYYDCSGKPWPEEEDTQLLKEYNEDNMDIIEIGYIHRRTPGGIAYRLKRLEVVDNSIDTRGYEEYQASNLYREIVGGAKRNKSKEKEQTNIVNVKKTTPTLELEIAQLKDEMRIIKSTLSEIHSLLKAVYKFETKVVDKNTKKGTFVNSYLN